MADYGVFVKNSHADWYDYFDKPKKSGSQFWIKKIKNGAGDGNRTRVISLEGWCSTIELHLRHGGSDGNRTRGLLRDREAC